MLGEHIRVQPDSALERLVNTPLDHWCYGSWGLLLHGRVITGCYMTHLREGGGKFIMLGGRSVPARFDVLCIRFGPERVIRAIQSRAAWELAKRQVHSNETAIQDHDRHLVGV